MTLLKSLNKTHQKPGQKPNLGDDELKPPDSLTFFKSILKPSGDCTANTNRIVACISQVIVFNVLGWITALQKHFPLGLGLHCLVGSRKVIDILHRFGHCVNHNYMCYILRWSCTKECKGGFHLTIQSKCPNKTIFTHFWVDNFGVVVGRQASFSKPMWIRRSERKSNLYWAYKISKGC